MPISKSQEWSHDKFDNMYHRFLHVVYVDWCVLQQLKRNGDGNFLSAEDYLYGEDVDLTMFQKEWLRNFVDIWDYISSFSDPAESTRNPDALRLDFSQNTESDGFDYLRQFTGGE
tara:strand:- start:9 stop:353 length:345 start_codon:yes stop_codon:yes gene_type:complete